MNFRKFLPGKLGKKATIIPVVKLTGAIAAGSGPLSRTISMANVAALLDRAFKIKEAPCVALSINSPGGSPVQSRLIYQRVRELADKHDKRVLVFVEDVAASGGYMLAIAGDEIFVDETSIVGSIGVVSAGFGFSEAIDKLGIERRVYTAGKNKVKLDPFQPEKQDDIEYIKELQLEIHQVFIDMVKERRGTKLADDDDLFTGNFWTGIRAKGLGLVDGFGHIGSVVKQRYGDDAQLKVMTPKKNLLGRAVGANGISLSGQIVDQAAEIMEEKAMRSRFGL